MRKITNINQGWDFTKDGITQKISLPHTWNGLDGQGAEETYYRGRCVYERVIPSFEGRVYLEINGANTVCEVFINGVYIGSHENGYSMFRFEITDFINSDMNVIRIIVDNSENEYLYPQMADFTFYGGIYRDVNIISDVDRSHFSLLDMSRSGIYITPKADGRVFVKSYVEGGSKGLTKEFIITDAQGNEVAKTSADADTEAVKLLIEEPVLWNGMKNPYLYTMTARLLRDGEVIDEVSERFGLREFYFDSEKGFFLNGEHLKLKGVSRHQDREDIGNALTAAEHKEDIEIIKEVGANSIRLAHYQHDEKFYKMCDEEGFLVWAEIPVISKFSKKKQDQAKFMLEELIRQNYNHPSIYCWSIENEISIAGTASGLISGISELNNIAHCLDSTRPTACAQVTFCPISSKLNEITDILGYNQYFGWYVQTVDGIDKWLDDFHEKKPNIKLCISEYGAEGITTLHSAQPVQGDYSEEYQAYYHEHYIKALTEREWLWGSYVWNMFDFGSAKRNEGGVRGRNNKGLVTIDRKIKKDSFYVYKAFWSDEKFVHIAGERFVDRPVGAQKIKVYSNCESVTLTVNGEKTELSGDKIFEFDAVINQGENVITAVSGDCTHEIKVNGTDVPNPSYKLSEGGETFVRNWFGAGDEIDPARLSLNDSLGEIIFNPEVQKLIKNHVGVSLDMPVLKPLGKLPLKPISKIASKLGAENYISLANQFLQTIEKEK
ncbi:MAG: glycoside hydrolase family 2 TIM barrel-domain containing protein [Clostridiaceae bacterium]|nr:glycoside hydrolase family 2 TIM barrel-domain containing protein [Clostridiaceae bacterium]